MKKISNKLSQGLAGAYLAADGPYNKGLFDNLIRPRTSGLADPKDVVVNIINYALFFVGVIALVFIVWGGIKYITSGGDAEKTTSARNTLMYAILGIIIIAIAYLIVRWAGGAPIVT